MSLKSILRIAEEYIRRNPTPVATETYSGILKLVYSQIAPTTNSKTKK